MTMADEAARRMTNAPPAGDVVGAGEADEAGDACEPAEAGDARNAEDAGGAVGAGGVGDAHTAGGADKAADIRKAGDARETGGIGDARITDDACEAGGAGKAGDPRTTEGVGAAGAADKAGGMAAGPVARRVVLGGLLAGGAAPAWAAAGGAVHVADFGAVGDGRTDDSAAIRRALAALRPGGTLRFAAGRTYFCGAYRQSGDVFAVDGLRGVTILGDGATLLTRSIGRGTKTMLFRLRDFHDVRIAGLNGRDDGTDLRVDWQGQYFVMAEASIGPCTGLVLEDVTVTDAVALLYVTGWRGRMRDIRLRRCVAIRCYYGMVFEENGDGVDAELVTRNCRRSYFAYGGRGHRIALRIHHDGAGPGADACCLVKRYLLDTHDIDLHARFIGPALPFAYAAKLEQHPYDRTAPGLIADIRIRLEIATAGRPADHMIPLGLSSYTEAGVEERGETANRWQGITLSGHIPADYLAAHGVPLVAARVRPRVTGDIRIAPGLPPPPAGGVAGFLIRR